MKDRIFLTDRIFLKLKMLASDLVSSHFKQHTNKYDRYNRVVPWFKAVRGPFLADFSILQWQKLNVIFSEKEPYLCLGHDLHNLSPLREGEGLSHCLIGRCNVPDPTPPPLGAMCTCSVEEAFITFVTEAWKVRQ